MNEKIKYFQITFYLKASFRVQLEMACHLQDLGKPGRDARGGSRRIRVLLLYAKKVNISRNSLTVACLGSRHTTVPIQP